MTGNIDPIAGKQGILVHPKPNCPHYHENDVPGKCLGIDGKIVSKISAKAHLPSNIK